MRFLHFFITDSLVVDTHIKIIFRKYLVVQKLLPTFASDQASPYRRAKSRH